MSTHTAVRKSEAAAEPTNVPTGTVIASVELCNDELNDIELYEVLAGAGGKSVTVPPMANMTAPNLRQLFSLCIWRINSMKGGYVVMRDRSGKLLYKHGKVDAT